MSARELTPKQTSKHLSWIGLGVALMLGSLFLALISGRFAYEASVRSSPVLWVVTTLLILGFAYLSLLWLIPRTPQSRALVAWVLLVGAVMRVAMAFSTPMLEDDFYRYLWDGAVVANGLNPYGHPPADHEAPGGDAALQVLGRDAGMTVDRVNHPHLTTIYPPLAQAVFALSHWLKPWSLDAWRLLLFCAETAGVALLLVILVELGRSPLWVAIYWWNPLASKEIANSAHMDALLVPLLLATLLLCIRGRRNAAALVLACATAVKLWPILLLPVVVVDTQEPWRETLARVVLFALLGAILTFPLWTSGLNPASGLIAYSRGWENNDALFMVLSVLVGWLSETLGLAESDVGLLTRLLVAGFVVTLSLRLAHSPDTRPSGVCERFMWVTATLFLLMPAQFPWYFVWLVPLLALAPRLSLLLLTPLLSLYYLRFYFAARGSTEVFEMGVVWIEYIPVWALLVIEWWRQRAYTNASAPWVTQGAR
jgi:hypothetical protein